MRSLRDGVSGARALSCITTHPLTARVILRHGLDPRYDSEAGVPGWQPAVYLTSNPHPGLGEVALRVDVRGLRLHPDPTLRSGRVTERGARWYAVHEPISARRIRRTLR